jgi:Spy/CpxP family protein refolding chaperone
MRSRRNPFTIAACLAFGFVVATAMAASAQPGGMPGQMGQGQMPPGGRGQMPPPGMGGGPMWQGAVMRLDLTEAQRADIKSLIDTQRESNRALREQARALHEQLATAIYGASPDSASTSDLVQKLADANRQMLEADVALQQRVSALLTEAQRADLVKLLTQRPPRGGPPMM